MSSSYDENCICWSIEICTFFPFPYRPSIISCICSSTSQPLFSLLCKRLGWMAPARQMFPVLAFLTRETNTGGMLQLSLSALWSPCTEQAWRPDCLLNQAESLSAPSRILIPTSVTSTAYDTELGPLHHTVQHVQAVRDRHSPLPCPYPASLGHKSVAEVPYSALKSCSVLTTQEMSEDIQQLHLLGDIVLVTIMSVSAMIWVCHEPLKSSCFGLPLLESGILGKETDGKGQDSWLKAGSSSYLNWEY